MKRAYGVMERVKEGRPLGLGGRPDWHLLTAGSCQHNFPQHLQMYAGVSCVSRSPEGRVVARSMKLSGVVAYSNQAAVVPSITLAAVTACCIGTKTFAAAVQKNHVVIRGPMRLVVNVNDQAAYQCIIAEGNAEGEFRPVLSAIRGACTYLQQRGITTQFTCVPGHQQGDAAAQRANAEALANSQPRQCRRAFFMPEADFPGGFPASLEQRRSMQVEVADALWDQHH